MAIVLTIAAGLLTTPAFPVLRLIMRRSNMEASEKQMISCLMCPFIKWWVLRAEFCQNRRSSSVFREGLCLGTALLALTSATQSGKRQRHLHNMVLTCSSSRTFMPRGGHAPIRSVSVSLPPPEYALSQGSSCMVFSLHSYSRLMQSPLCLCLYIPPH
jgi:hypothetical protein